MAQIGNLDFRAFVDDRKEKRVGGAEAPEVPYAYVSDRTTRAAFQKMKPVELAVAATVRLFKAVGKNELLGHAVKVGPRQFPRVHELAVRCSDTLGIAVPTMYIVNEPRMNAATYGTNDDSFILIHSGLIDHFTDEELLEIDRFVRRNTTEKFGPVREVTHEADKGLVLEVAFEGLQRSMRHKSGLAMRFPRISRLRWDKPPREADRLETLERLLKSGTVTVE